MKHLTSGDQQNKKSCSDKGTCFTGCVCFPQNVVTPVRGPYPRYASQLHFLEWGTVQPPSKLKAIPFHGYTLQETHWHQSWISDLIYAVLRRHFRLAVAMQITSPNSTDTFHVQPSQFNWKSDYVTCWTAKASWFVSRQGQNICFSSKMFRQTKPLIQWAQMVLSLEAKRQGNEPHHSPPSSAEVKNQWSRTPLPHMNLWRA
jgi:hypothetical protein